MPKRPRIYNEDRTVPSINSAGKNAHVVSHILKND